jgi:hypothetical protein
MKLLGLMAGVLLAAGVGFAADFSKKSTDELLGMRGTMTTEQERVQLHNELKNREKTMTQEQLQKFQTYPPENRVKKFKNQGGGQGLGNGKGGGKGMGGGNR